MIHIHRCTLVIEGQNALRDRSTISMNRVKEILVKQLSGLEHLSGRVHLKQLTLDLGEFENLEFNSEFIKRFENACSGLEEKLRELHRTQLENQPEEDKAVLDELIAFLYSLDQSQEVRNMIYLLESNGFAPKKHEWQKIEARYAKQFGSEMNAELSKRLKSMLVNSKAENHPEITTDHSTNKDTVKSNDDLNQEHIDFLIDGLDRIPMNVNWLNVLNQRFEREFGSKMSLDLFNRIRKVYDSFEFTLSKNQVNHDNFRESVLELNARLRSFFGELEENTESNNFQRFVQNTPNFTSDGWFSEFIFRYKQEFGTNLPFALENRLIQFKHELNESENPLSWSDIERTKRHRIIQKMAILKGLASELKNDVKSTRKEPFSEEEFTFLTDQLKNLPLNVAWFSQLTSNYKKRFDQPMSKTLHDLFLRFSEELFIPERQSNWEKINHKNWIERIISVMRELDPMSDLLHFLEKLADQKSVGFMDTYAAFERAYHDFFGQSLSEDHLILLSKTQRFIGKQQYQEVFSRTKHDLFNQLAKNSESNEKKRSASSRDLYRFNPELFEDMQLDFAWLANVNERFERVYHQKMPREMMRKIVSYLLRTKGEVIGSNFFMQLASTHGRVAILPFIEFLRACVGITDQQELLEILPSADGPQKWLKIDEIIDGFKAYFGRQMDQNLKNEIVKFGQRSGFEQLEVDSIQTKAKAKSQLETYFSELAFKRKEAIVATELKKALLKEFQSKNETNNPSGNQLKEENDGQFFAEAIDFILSYLNRSKLSVNWKSNLKKRFWEHFQTPIPSKWLEILDAFYFNPNDGNSSHVKSTVISSPDASILKDALLKEFQSKNEANNSSENQLKEENDRQFLAEAIDFILSYLNRSKLSINWKNELNKRFSAQFNTVIPLEWLELIDASDFNPDQNSTKTAPPMAEINKIELIDYLQSNQDIPGAEKLGEFCREITAIESLALMFQQYETFTDEALSVGLKMMLQRWWASQNTKVDAFPIVELKANDDSELLKSFNFQLIESEFEDQETMHFLRDMIESVPLDVCWLAVVSDQYKKQFGRQVPSSIFKELLAFTQAFSSELNAEEANITAKKQAVFDVELLLKEIADGMEQCEDLHRLEAVLMDFKYNSSAFSIVTLMERFEKKFGSEISEDLIEKIVEATAKTHRNKWAMLPRIERESLMENVKKILVTDRRNDERSEIEKSTFSERLTFLIRTLERTVIDASWYAKIHAAYVSEFGTEMSQELSDCLLQFSDEISIKKKTEKPNNAANFSHRENVKMYIHYFLSDQFSREEIDRFMTLPSTVKMTETGSWLEEMIWKFESEIEAFNPSQKKSLLLLRNEFLEVGKSTEEMDAFTEMKNYLDTNFINGDSSENNSEKFIESRNNFILQFFSTHEMNLENLKQCEAAFNRTFEWRIDAKLRAFLVRLMLENDKAGSQDYAVKKNTNRDAVIEKLTSKTKAKTDLESCLYARDFLVSKMEQLLLGLVDFKQISDEYIETFNVEMSDEILNYCQSIIGTKNHENTKNADLKDKLNQYLRKNASNEQLARLSVLIESTSDLTVSNWFSAILTQHKEQSGKSLPIDLQQLLLKFAAQKTPTQNNHESDKNSQVVKWKNAVLKKWNQFSNEQKIQLKIDIEPNVFEQLDFIKKYLRKTALTTRELSWLRKHFFRSFGIQIPVKWLAFLQELPERKSIDDWMNSKLILATINGYERKHKFNKNNTKNQRQSSTETEHELVRNELENYLKSFPDSIEKNHLFKVINRLPSLTQKSWFQQLIDGYPKVVNEKMPMNIQSALLKFMKEKSISKNYVQSSSIDESFSACKVSDLLKDFQEEIDILYVNEIIESEVRVNPEMIAKMLLDSKDTVDLESLENTYQRWFKKELPASLTDQLINLKSDRNGLKSVLLGFLQSKNEPDLFNLVSEQKDLAKDSWFELLEKCCTRSYDRPLSSNEKKILLSFAANYEFKSTEQTEKKRAISENLDQAISLVGNWIASEPSLFLDLSERYDLVRAFLSEKQNNSATFRLEDKRELQQKFVAYFDVSYSIAEIDRLLDSVANSEKTGVIRPSTQLKQKSTLRPIKSPTRKVDSNKVKLLRLREQLKKMKEGKKVEELPIIQNAGMIFGWVFWKSIFTDLSWVKDGKFILNNEIDTAVFAANWMNYAVGETETANDLILFICGLEENSFVRLSRSELEGKMNGQTLDASIENYYLTILSMWPIFNTEQLPDFIELFIQREGLMQKSPVGMRVKLVKEPIDALAEQQPLPWPISIINFSWNSNIIEVEW